MRYRQTHLTKPIFKPITQFNASKGFNFNEFLVNLTFEI